MSCRQAHLFLIPYSAALVSQWPPTPAAIGQGQKALGMAAVVSGMAAGVSGMAAGVSGHFGALLRAGGYADGRVPSLQIGRAHV